MKLWNIILYWKNEINIGSQKSILIFFLLLFLSFLNGDFESYQSREISIGNIHVPITQYQQLPTHSQSSFSYTLSTPPPIILNYILTVIYAM